MDRNAHCSKGISFQQIGIYFKYNQNKNSVNIRILKISLISMRQYGNNNNQIEKRAVYRIGNKNGKNIRKEFNITNE